MPLKRPRIDVERRNRYVWGRTLPFPRFRLYETPVTGFLPPIHLLAPHFMLDEGRRALLSKAT